MSQILYHLRPNKAVDRLTLVDAIRHAIKPEDLRQYAYYGMGGPTLEDFRLIYEFFPEFKMVCIEDHEEVHKRQKFHRPCSSPHLKLEHATVGAFLAQYDPKEEKSIFWLDYVRLNFSNFDDFMALLGKVGPDSLVKITLHCDPRDYLHPNPETRQKQQEAFRRKFEKLLPGSFTTPPVEPKALALLLQSMLQIASQKILTAGSPKMFLPISSFYYSDGAGMFTLTGVVCLRNEEVDYRIRLKKWRFAKLDWDLPTEINVPVLSTKERLHLQRQLPRNKNAGKNLRRCLGYLIGGDETETEAQLQQYADFHRYFPYFVKAVP